MNWSLLKYFWDFISARNVCCLSWICRSAWNEVQNFCLILLNKSTFENNYILEKKANCFNSKMWLDQIKICICIPLNPKLKFHFESKHRIWWTLCKVDDNLPLSSSFSGISSGIWQTRRATSRSLHLQLQSCPAGLLIGCLSYCLPAIGPPDPIRFFHRHTLNGEDILAPVLLSEQTSSFYFFHIFVPSLPHYLFFFWISHFSISLIWLVCEVDHRLDTQTQALQSVHLIEWLMFLLSLKNRLFLSPEAFKRNQILTQEVITFQDG